MDSVAVGHKKGAVYEAEFCRSPKRMKMDEEQAVTTIEASKEDSTNNLISSMRELKISCSSLIENQLLKAVTEEKEDEEVTLFPNKVKEHYAPGMASFQGMYSLLDKNPSHSLLSPAKAFCAVLQLASEKKMRLIPQKDMKDFKIRQISDFKEE